MTTINFSRPLFIVGFGRSGTKLLREILHGHPNICLNDIETNFLPYLWENWASFGDLRDERQFAKFYRNVTCLPYFEYQRDRGRLISSHAWFDAIREFSIAGVFEALVTVDLDLGRSPNVIWGDKSPTYTRSVSRLKDIFPRARFIHIIRDARDVVLSSMQAWDVNPYRTAQRWNESVSVAHTSAVSFPADVLEIRYEDLLGCPEVTVRHCCTHLGLEYFESMLDMKRAPENLGSAKGETRIVPNNVNKGKFGLKPSVRRRVEEITCDGLRTFRYEVSADIRHKPVSKIAMIAYRLRDGSSHLRREMRTRGIVRGTKFVLRFFIQNLRAGM